MAKSYDAKCLELAEHFLSDIGREDLADALARFLQDSIEDWIEAEAGES